MTTTISGTAEVLGGCPVCGDASGYVNAGRTHRAYCLEHKTTWIGGANLFSSWHRETEEEQRTAYDAVFSGGGWTEVEDNWTEIAG